MAFADYETGDLAWCGWPEGLARIADCALFKAVNDEDHVDKVSAVIKCGGMRGARVSRLYPIETPVAWLWQNAEVLDEGCYQFYPTAARASAEIAYAGGWKTPVYAQAENACGADPKASDVFYGLDDHRASWERLNVSPERAAAIEAYMAAEQTAVSFPERDGRADA